MPNGHLAFIDPRKLTDYCLSDQSVDGRHKARVFRSTLGLTVRDTQWLTEQLLRAAREEPAVVTRRDQFGRRYQIDSFVQYRSRRAVIRSAWIIRTSETFPRLVSCYVK